MEEEGPPLRSARLVSRVSFEPLSTLDTLNGGLSRDGSGVSVESANAEYESWRVRRVGRAALTPSRRLLWLSRRWHLGA